MGELGVQHQLRLLQRVLAAAPDDAAFAVVAIGRTPTMIVGPWRSVRQPTVPSLSLVNGSDVQGAVQLAAKLIEDIDRGHEHGRIIVLSDFEQASATPPTEDIVGTTPTTTLLVRVNHEGWDFSTESDTPLAVAAARGGGAVLVPRHRDDDDQPIVLHLLHAIELTDITVRVGGLELTDVRGTVPTSMRTLDRASMLHSIAGPSGGQVTLRGRMWGTLVEVPLGAMPAAQVLEHGLTIDRTPGLIRAAGLQGGMVTQATSLTRVPSFRPPGNGAMSGASGCSCGVSCCGGGTRGVGTGTMMVQTALLGVVNDTILRGIADHCGVEGGVAASIEIGGGEILAVRADHPCVVEQLWAMALSSSGGSFEAPRTIQLLVGT